jgi:hypothetical protein
MVPRWRRTFHDLVQIRHRDRILRFVRYVKSIAGIVGQVFKGSWSYCIIRNGASGQGGRRGNYLSLQLLLVSRLGNEGARGFQEAKVGC